MHVCQHDPSLTMPAIEFAAASGGLPFDAAPLRRHFDSTDGLCIGGRHVEACLSSDSIRTITIDGTTALCNLRVVHAVPRAAALTSIGVERISDISAVQITERFMVLPDIAAFIAEWSSPSRHAMSVEWMHDLHGPSRWNTSSSALLLASPAGSICVAFANTTVAWDVENVVIDGTPRLRVRADITAAREGTLLYATSSRLSSAIPSVLRSLRDAVPLARAFVASQRRRAQESLTLESPDTARDDALAWAVQSIAVPRPHANRVASHPVLHALAACAAGSADIARGIIGSLPDRDPFLPLLVARYHAWTADSAFVATQWNRTQDAVAAMIDAPVSAPAEIALAAAALAEIAATAGDIGRPALTTDVQARVKQYRFEHAEALRAAHWLDAVHDAEADALGTGLHDPVGFATHSPAAIIADVAFGIFGIEPEAARNRIRFRTHLPAAWENASIRGVRAGDASLALRYSRTFDGDIAVHRFEAVQEMGAVPIRLLLEPLIAAERLRSATVDSVAANLDVRSVRGRILVPVQLVLDDVRVLEIVTDRPARDSINAERRP